MAHLRIHCTRSHDKENNNKQSINTQRDPNKTLKQNNQEPTPIRIKSSSHSIILRKQSLYIFLGNDIGCHVTFQIIFRDQAGGGRSSLQ